MGHLVHGPQHLLAPPVLHTVLAPTGGVLSQVQVHLPGLVLCCGVLLEVGSPQLCSGNFKDSFKVKFSSQMLHSTSVLYVFPSSKLNLIVRSTLKQSINDS